MDTNYANTGTISFAAGCLRAERLFSIPAGAMLLNVRTISFLDLDAGQWYELIDCARLFRMGQDVIAVCDMLARVSLNAGEDVHLSPGIWRVSTT